MPRKKVDNRIRILVENGIITRQRSMFVIVGDKGRDQASCDVIFIDISKASETYYRRLLSLSQAVCFMQVHAFMILMYAC